MFRSKYSSALLLVGFSILALSIVQIFWIKDALNLEEEQFNKRINDVLFSTGLELEEAYFCHELFANLRIQPGQGIYIVKKEWEAADGGKRGVWKESGLTDTVGLYWKTPGGDSLVEYKTLKLMDGYAGNLTIKLNNSDLSKSIKPNRRLLDSLRQNPKPTYFKQLVEADQSIMDFLPDDLDSLLSVRFMEEGINAPFELGVFRESDLKTIYASSKEHIFELRKSNLSAPLLKDNNFYEQYRITVFFPGSSVFIRGRSQTFLVISIFIIGCLILSLWIYVRFQQRQRELSEMRTDFVNNMTHEFKTPLANISLALETIEELNSKNLYGRYLEIIKEEKDRLITNVERILQIARIAKGERIRLNLKQVDIHEMLDAVKDKNQLRAKQQGATISVNNAAEQSTIVADRFHITNVVSNVVDNAFKYANREHIEIDIKTRGNGRGIYVTIADNGVGMPKEDTKKIFEPFYRRPTGDVHTVKGFGLGLNYAKRIVEMHQGTIKAESVVGQGTEFEIFLPYEINITEDG